MPVQKLELTCATCRTRFSRYPSQQKGKKKAYCSNECRYESRRNGKWAPHNKLTNKQVLGDLKALRDTIGRTPGISDVHARWPNRQIIFSRRFGSFRNALLAAGIEPSPIIVGGERVQDPYYHDQATAKRYPHNKGQTKHTNNELIEELKRVANAIGHTPTDQEFRIHGKCSISSYWNQFGNWANACRLAGLLPHTTGEGIPRVDFYDHIRRIDGMIVELQGSYESRMAVKLDALNMRWLCHGEFDWLIWIDDNGKTHKYAPDFYLVDLDVYIETKGWFRERDQIKMRHVVEQNPNKTIIIVLTDDLAHFEATGELPDT